MRTVTRVKAAASPGSLAAAILIDDDADATTAPSVMISRDIDTDKAEKSAVCRVGYWPRFWSAVNRRRGRLSNGPFDINNATSPGCSSFSIRSRIASGDSQATVAGPRAVILRASTSVL